jgi:hypothetical protein
MTKAINTINLDQLVTVTGGTSIMPWPTSPAYMSANGKVRVFQMPGGHGSLKIVNSSRFGRPHVVIVNPVMATTLR